MNRLTRLTALLLAMLMIFSTVATAETAYQVGGMTVDNWQEIVDSAEEKLFTIDEGDSGKEVTPPPVATPTPGAYYPYTDGTTTALAVNAQDSTTQMTASGVAVLQNAEAGQWQMQIGSTWINITGATGSELWATSAMMNGMESANFRKAFGERNAETGEYASYTNVATVEIVAEVAGAMFMMSRAAEDEGEAAPTVTPPPAANDIMTLAEANPDLSKYHIFIHYVFGDSSEKTGQAAEPYHAEVSTNKQNFSAKIKYPDVKGYEADYANAYVQKDGATATEDLPSWVSCDENYVNITNAVLSGDVNIYVPYKPAKNTFDVYYWEELVEYTTDNDGETVKYKLVHKIENIEGLTEDPVKNSYPEGAATQYYATLRNAAADSGFKALMYDEDIDIAADGSTVVNVYYQRLYYLMTFDLGGGYGVNPIYTKHGAEIAIDGEAQRPGYQFMGWTEDKNATVYTPGQTFAEIPDTMPIGGKQYYAVWKPVDVTQIQIVFWGENADDEEYSYIKTETLNIAPGTSFTYNPNNAGNLVCPLEENHVHDASCGLICTETEHTHESNCYKLVCQIEAHTHSAACYANCSHTHSQDCYVLSAGSWQQTTQPSVGNYQQWNDLGNGVYTHVYYNWGWITRYYVKIGDIWYNSTNNNATITFNCNHDEHTADCLSCDQPEHTHTDYLGTCYALECPLSVHIHSGACYSCGKTDHTHTDDCYLPASGLASNLWTFIRSETVTVAADGSTVVNVYYDRTTFTLTFRADSNTVATITDKWGAYIADEFNKAPFNTTYNGRAWRCTETNKYGYALQTLDRMPQFDATFNLYNKSSNTLKTIYYYVENVGADVSANTWPSNANNFTLLKEVDTYFNYATYEEEYHLIEGFTRYDASVAGFSGSRKDFSNNRLNLYYLRNDYQITFNNGEEDINTETMPYQASLAEYANYRLANTDMPSFYQEGSRQFAGWYWDPECTDGTEVDFANLTMPAGDLIVYAKWSPYTYSVFVYNHAADAEKALAELETTPDTVTTSATPIYYWINKVEHGDPTSSAFSYQNSWYDPNKNEYVQPTPEREGYVFKLWYYYDENGDPQPFSFGQTPITRDTVVFAGWEANAIADYTIYYVVSDGIDDDNVPVAPEHYLNKDNWVADPLTDSGLAGAYITEYAKLPNGDGYFPLKASHSFFLEVEAEENVYAFEYRPVDNMPYVVHYVTATQPETGNYEEIQLVVDGVEGTYYKLIASKTVNPNTKAVVTENYEPIGGSYVPDAFQKRLYIEAGMPEDKRVIVFIYTKDESKTTLKVNHYLVHADGTVVNTPYDYAYQIVDLEYSDTLETMDIPNYTYDATRTTRQDGDGQAQHIDNLTITIAEGSPEVTVNLYYKENTATINYEAVGPDGAQDFGSVLPETEENVIGVITGVPTGSTATAGAYYEFVGWYSDEECTQPVPSTWVEDNKIVPTKTEDEVWDDATYYAKFVEKEAEIVYVAIGPDGATDFGTVALKGSNESGKTQTGETVPVKTGVATGATADPNDPTFKFVGWYTKNEQDEYVKIDGAVANYIPNKDGDAWPELSTYYAIFDYDVGHLSITKIVDNSTGFTPTQKTFTFTVKLTGENLNDAYEVKKKDGTVVESTWTKNGNDRTGTFTLPATEITPAEVVIEGILNGTAYTVTEDSVTGYTTTSTGASANIVAGQTVAATFTNKYDVGSLDVTKTVVGTVTDVYPSNFNFTLEFKDANGTVVTPNISVTGAAVTVTDNKYTFTLTNGGKAEITGIPQGVTYTVTEEDCSAYYTTTYTGATGKMTANGEMLATFTNTAKTGELTITKIISGDGADAGDTFLFNVEGPNSYQTTVVLTGGQSITLSELYFGQYTVTENTAWSWRYTVDGSATQTKEVLPTTLKPAASFTNERTENKWLDGETAADNKFNEGGE